MRAGRVAAACCSVCRALRAGRLFLLPVSVRDFLVIRLFTLTGGGLPLSLGCPWVCAFVAVVVRLLV